jgi:UDP-N-acetylmuramate--alanine ligase
VNAPQHPERESTAAARLGRVRNVHFVGIGGAGMSALAELLLNLGYRVSGSDLVASSVTERLSALGARVAIGHDPAHVGEADLVVASSAVRTTNPELAEARRRGIPVVSRAELLAELMRSRTGIAVAGAHGKTTTTSMIALVLWRAGLDPTAVIGGRLSAFGSGARLGRGRYMVAEADESDGSFLRLQPAIAVITNVDREHLEAYRHSFAALQQAFVQFAHTVPADGLVVACVDDPAVAALVAQIRRRVVTYGLEPLEADVTGAQIELAPFAARCAVYRRTPAGCARLGELHLQVPGRHNLLNALAAVAVSEALGVDFARAAAALAEFRGAERRFERRGEAGGVLVVDDYGHHPTEIRAVLAAARTIGRRVLVVFQPHRYTRTQALIEEFGAALGGADEIVLTEIYPAGEDPIPGVTLEALAAAVRRATRVPLHVVPRLEALPGVVATRARPGDLVITLGAGSIGTMADRILRALAARSATEGGESAAQSESSR